MRFPTADELKEISESFGFELDAEDLAEFRPLVEGGLASYEALDRMDDPQTSPAAAADRGGGRRGLRRTA